MGRHSAGDSFLRAAVAARVEKDLWAYTSSRNSAEAFAKQVRSIDGRVNPKWCPKHRLDLLGEIGTLYYPGPDVGALAKLRLRQGVDAFSLCGVTHTLASHSAMDALVGTLQGPVMPWDAIICTSTATRKTVEALRGAEQDYLKWRFGEDIDFPDSPQFPIIPLGIHVRDFEYTDEYRKQARAALDLADDEVVVLFVGRLSFHAKAHPDAMYLALEEVARAGAKKVTLVQCGWFANEAIEASFRQGASNSAPHVRALFADGGDPEKRRQCWAAADIFISLSDNIQETFGITPLEAMASGLPVVVTDWDGYQDTVRHGVDGFRVPTYMPPAGAGVSLAKSYEDDSLSYDRYCGYSCTLVSVDLRDLVDKLTVLVENPELRRTMGQAGKRHAAQTFDWQVVYASYQNLWAELSTIRKAARGLSTWRDRIHRAPNAAAGRADPFLIFEQYPTESISPDTLVSKAHRVDGASFETLIDHPLFVFAKPIFPNVHLAQSIQQAAVSPISVAALSQKLGVSIDEATMAAAVLTKMGLTSFSKPASQDEFVT